MASLLYGSLDLLAEPFKALVGTSMGAWVSVTTTADSLFVDGAVVSGDSTGNREIVLQVRVTGASRPDLIAACEALISQANLGSNELAWTPDDGPASVYETFRAAGPQRVDDGSEGPLLRRVYELHLPAKPFVKSAVREQAVASPPGVSVDDMESSALGVSMQRQIPGIAAPSMVATGGPTVDGSVSPIVRLSGSTVRGGALSATGGTVADGTGAYSSVAVVSSSGAGVVSVKTGSTWATSADFVTADWAVVFQTSTGTPRTYQAGIEWLNASNAVVRTDWAPPISFETGSNASPRAVSAASPRPSTATKARPLLRITAQAASEAYSVYFVALQPSAAGTVTPYPTAHDGAGSAAAAVLAGIDAPNGTGYYRYGTPYVYRTLPAPLDLSAQVRLRAWHLHTGDQMSPVAVRLWDASGNWSRYDYTPPITKNTWAQVAWDLASPTDTSTTPCNLAGVIAWDMTAALQDTSTDAGVYTVAGVLDTLTAGPADTPNMSPRGTVLTLDPIKGSARTTAAVTLTNTTAMTDWLVACIDGTEGAPLLTITSNKATAGVGYDGTYSVIAALSPATSLASPTCAVVQKVGGTTVATQVLTGLQKAGNRYIDFGSVALPLVGLTDENTNVTYEFTLTPTSANYAELLVIDVDASLAWMPNLSTARKVAMIDEPLPGAPLGQVWQGDLTDRSDAMAPLNPPVTPSPIRVQAPSTRLLVYSTTGAPSVTLTYWPRYLVEVTQ